MYDNEDKLFIQHLTAEIKNGKNKGSIIHLTNEYSSSGAYDQSYETGNDVFVSIDKQQAEDEALTGSISNVKRDKYIVIVAWVFIIILLLVGKKQGLFASISLRSEERRVGKECRFWLSM